MKSTTPEVTRVYQNHHLDSTRWELYTPRDKDVIVSTAYKSGTTWTQMILHNLIHGNQDPMPELGSVTPWPDAYFHPVGREDLGRWIEGLEGQRILKSHLPLDGLPYYDNVRYIIVGRDPRDVFMSLFNHYWNYTEGFYRDINDPKKLMGEPFPICPEDPRELWPDWITRGWFEWEKEGYPFWSNLHHTQTYWDYKHLPNFLFLHYSNMLSDLDGAVREIAGFVRLEATDEDVERAVEATTFSNVKRSIKATRPEDDSDNSMFKGGADAFFYKGTNGRWKDVLSKEDLKLYRQTTERVLSPDCLHWLETGEG